MRAPAHPAVRARKLADALLPLVVGIGIAGGLVVTVIVVAFTGGNAL